MTKTEFLQTMTPTEVKSAPQPTPAEKALKKAGVSPGAPYYAGALRNVQQAIETRNRDCETFWKSYQLSLCAHLAQLEGTDKDAEKNMIRVSIRIVQAILYALED